MKILWLGPLSDKTKKRNPTLSPAADNWQRGLINGLSENGAKVKVFSFQPNPYFPKGKFRFGNNRSENYIEQIGYLNLPGLREESLKYNYKRILKNINDYQVVITYNCLKHHVDIGNWLKKKGTPWISIIADDEYQLGSDLYVFLSYRYYMNAKVRNKVHIEGGIDNIHRAKVFKSNKIVYTGSLTKWTGILPFTKQFVKLCLDDIELHIYGKGEMDQLENIARNNSKVMLHGFVSREELNKAMHEAYAFINPRPLDSGVNENNFPSKILEYLSYQKPILSTRHPGIHPDYKKVLFYYDPMDLESLSTTIEEVFSLSSNKLQKLSDKIRLFSEGRSWRSASKKLLEAINNCCE